MFILRVRVFVVCTWEYPLYSSINPIIVQGHLCPQITGEGCSSCAAQAPLVSATRVTPRETREMRDTPGHTRQRHCCDTVVMVWAGNPEKRQASLSSQASTNLAAISYKTLKWQWLVAFWRFRLLSIGVDDDPRCWRSPACVISRSRILVTTLTAAGRCFSLLTLLTGCGSFATTM